MSDQWLEVDPARPHLVNRYLELIAAVTGGVGGGPYDRNFIQNRLHPIDFHGAVEVARGDNSALLAGNVDRLVHDCIGAATDGLDDQICSYPVADLGESIFQLVTFGTYNDVRPHLCCHFDLLGVSSCRHDRAGSHRPSSCGCAQANGSRPENRNRLTAAQATPAHCMEGDS